MKNKFFPESKIKRKVYHYSERELKKFKPNFKEGYAAKQGVSPKAIFFLKNKVKKNSFLLKRPYILECYLDLRNPHVAGNKFLAKRKKESRINEEIDFALKNKNDGVIFKNIWDNQVWCTVYVAFSPKQIKILDSIKVIF